MIECRLGFPCYWTSHTFLLLESLLIAYIFSKLSHFMKIFICSAVKLNVVFFCNLIKSHICHYVSFFLTLLLLPLLPLFLISLPSSSMCLPVSVFLSPHPSSPSLPLHLFLSYTLSKVCLFYCFFNTVNNKKSCTDCPVFLVLF